MATTEQEGMAKIIKVIVAMTVISDDESKSVIGLKRHRYTGRISHLVGIK